MTPSLAEDDIGTYIEIGLVSYVALHADQTGLLGVLQVEPVALCDLPVDSLLDPGDLVNERVAIVVHHFDGKAVLRIDHPDEQEAGLLQ